MTDALIWHRIQFTFTVTFHYLFPQLTMGLVLLLLIWKIRAVLKNDESYNIAARFWGRIFALSFAMGVVTGIPLEFQFGTNWSRFSQHAGGVIGQTLAMEGVFAFFLESAFLGLFLFGERKLGPRWHLATAVAMFLGSWLSGYFIIATNAFMQHPVGFETGPDGTLRLADFGAFVLNPWAIWQYAHNMTASVITGSFVVASVGAYWALMSQHKVQAAICLRTGVIVGIIACIVVLFPTGDQHGKMVADHQPVTLAAMEGVFFSGPMAELAIIGQPDVLHHRLENPIVVPGILSFLAYGSFGSTVKGLEDFPTEVWPHNIELLYYSYHIMAGLGTMFLIVMGSAAYLLWRGRLEQNRRMLWVLMLAAPFPFIANTAGWWTAELGRQPWVVYGIQRTADASSPQVSAGDVVFTTLGFAGMYLLLGMLFLFQVVHLIGSGPQPRPEPVAAPASNDAPQPPAQAEGETR